VQSIWFHQSHPCASITRLMTLVLLILAAGCLALTAQPVVVVTAPLNGASVTGPVNYVASAISADCAQGILAIRIYSAPYVEAFTGEGGAINTYINLLPGTYNTVVQAWDNCGNVGKTSVTINVTGEAQPAGFVYALNFDEDNLQAAYIQGFTIVPGNGALAQTLQGPVLANVEPVAIASDKGGYRLYAADYISGDVFGYFIDREYGYLYPVPGTPFAANRSVTAVAVHPSGLLVFAALSEYAPGDGVAVFQVQSDGSLQMAPGSPYPTETGPQAFTMDPNGYYLYVADGSGYIDAFQINGAAATLSPLPGSPYQLPITSCEPGVSFSAYPVSLLDLGGNDLYAANGVAGVIDGFGVASDAGTLTALSGSPWEDTHCEGGSGIDYPQAWMSPKSLAVDGTGKFLYALNNFENNIAIYSIESDGALKFLKFTPTNSACYGAVRTDSTGNYLYAGACAAWLTIQDYNALVGFSINHSTGDLTPLPTSPYTYPEMGRPQGGRPQVQDVAVTP
jgi:6-phosphogluconolactonase (cycloisomerase 2 family)